MEQRKVEITLEDENISISTTLSPTELVFWMEYLKMQVLSGELKIIHE